MKIKEIRKRSIADALALVWVVFLQTEMKEYSEEGKQAFYEAIHDQSYIDKLDIFSI